MVLEVSQMSKTSGGTSTQKKRMHSKKNRHLHSKKTCTCTQKKRMHSKKTERQHLQKTKHLHSKKNDAPKKKQIPVYPGPQPPQPRHRQPKDGADD